jgi:urea transporter
MMAAIGFFGIDDSHDYFVAYVTAVALMTVWAGAIAFFPALLAIALAEVFAWRSVIYYLLAGGVIGLVANQASELAADPVFSGGPMVPMLAAGFVGGFTYWLIAGRLAGPERTTEMRDRRKQTGSGQ